MVIHRTDEMGKQRVARISCVECLCLLFDASSWNMTWRQYNNQTTQDLHVFQRTKYSSFRSLALLRAVNHDIVTLALHPHFSWKNKSR